MVPPTFHLFSKVFSKYNVPCAAPLFSLEIMMWFLWKKMREEGGGRRKFVLFIILKFALIKFSFCKFSLFQVEGRGWCGCRHGLSLWFWWYFVWYLQRDLREHVRVHCSLPSHCSLRLLILSSVHSKFFMPFHITRISFISLVCFYFVIFHISYQYFI